VQTFFGHSSDLVKVKITIWNSIDEKIRRCFDVTEFGGSKTLYLPEFWR
jgi:hypothetical protein